MVQLKSLKELCPNTGLLFIIAGMAVANYSYENYQQKYLNQGGSSPQVDTLNIVAASADEDVVLSNPAVDTDQHPLDPLSALELRLAGRIVQLYNRTSQWQFKNIGLREPDKTLIYPYFQTRTTPPAGLIPRRANVLISDPVTRIPILVVVNLSTRKVEQWREADAGQKIGTITAEDNDLSLEIVFNDPQVQLRLKANEYYDRSKLIGDIWDAGYVADNPNYSQARKLVQVYLYVIKEKGNNYYAHPLDFVVTVELGPDVVRSIENLPIQQGFDTSDRTGNSVPTADAEYLSDLLPPNSIFPASHRIKISQPDGPAFKIAGKEVTWLNLNFRMGYNPREGFHVYTVTYNDNGNIRPIIYRMSLSEAYLSYGDLRTPYDRKSSYDLGNGEFGSSLRTLPVHQFCRGNAYSCESDHHNEKAGTWTLQNSLCIVEEDAGVLWAHSDDPSGKTEAIRDRRLVLSSLVSYGNIDYWISWRFYRDATIELAIKVTGILSTHLLAVDVKEPGYGNLLMPQVYSQNYQHFFAVRVDADIDGLENTVSKEDIVQVPNGIGTKSVDLTTPAKAATNSSPNRSWKISNPNVAPSKLNGKAPSWKLIPQGTITPILLPPDSPLVENRLTWAKHNLWVLPYNSEQIYASGPYLDCGVYKWTNENANVNITNTDVVLWHVFNYVYEPEVEDWPILSSIGTIGFKLRPSNFFSQNPALYSTRAKEATYLDGTGATLTNPLGSSREL